MAQTLSNLPGVGAPVPLAGIEEALSDLWRQGAREDDEGSLTRTVTANLIAVAARRDQQALRAALQRATRRHPGRVFAVVFAPERDAPLRAYLEGCSRRQGSSTAIVLEQIDLVGGRGEAFKLPGLIRPLLLSDVPTHLFWYGALPEDRRDLCHLAELVDRVIVDSGTFADPLVELGKVESLETDPGFAAVDLTRFRLRPWRRALAEAFETFRWDPDAPTRVVVQHGRDHAGLAAATCLSAWLRARLGASTGLEGVDRPTEHSEPLALRLEHGEEREVTVCLRRAVRRIEMTITLADQCLLPVHVPASAGSTGDLLAAAMDGC